MSVCSCGDSKPVLIYACSGASDVGSISDLAARKLRDEKKGVMSCLAAVGAGLSGFVESAKAACKVVTIDGCATGCARKIMEKAGVSSESFVLTDMGFEKGKTSADAQAVEKAVSVIAESI